MVRTEEYNVAVSKKETYVDIYSAGPLAGDVPLHFTLHYTLNEVAGPGLNDKLNALMLSKNGGAFVAIKSMLSHGIFNWYGAIGYMNGCVDFEIDLTEGTYRIYGVFPGDAEYEEVRTPEYTVVVGKKATYIAVHFAGPLAGAVPLHFTLHFTLNEVDGPGLNDKTCYLWVSKDGGDFVKKKTIVSHGIFNWYGAVGWMDGCVDFEIDLKEAGTYIIYGEFPGDTEHEGCKTEVITRKVTAWSCEE